MRTGAVQETILPREHSPVDVDMSRLARYVDEAKLRHLFIVVHMVRSGERLVRLMNVVRAHLLKERVDVGVGRPGD